MSSLWHHTRESLDESLSLLSEDLGKLQAAKPVDVAEIIRQFEAAAESARNLRSLISSEMPDASWQSREELEALLERIQRDREVRALRSRLSALASELERGSIVHRRATRAEQVNLLRDQAIKELRFLSEREEVPPALPGPEADQWVGWASGLKEPEDAESLEILRNSFVHLDAFVAHLEPEMWQIEAETLA
jgi:hypothetical protein